MSITPQYQQDILLAQTPNADYSSIINKYWAIKREIAIHTSDQSILNTLSKDPNEEVLAAVAYNIHTHTDTLNLLSKNKSILIRTMLIRNPSTQYTSLFHISKSNDFTTKINLAERLNCPIDIQENLSTDSHYEVRLRIAQNSTNYQILQQLANDKNPRVIDAVAQNINTSSHTLKSLLNSPSKLFALNSLVKQKGLKLLE